MLVTLSSSLYINLFWAHDVWGTIILIEEYVGTTKLLLMTQRVLTKKEWFLCVVLPLDQVYNINMPYKINLLFHTNTIKGAMRLQHICTVYSKN